MKKFLKITFILSFLVASQQLFGQFNINIFNPGSHSNLSISDLNNQKEEVKSREKAELQKEIHRIDKALENEEITKEEADRKKQNAAEKHAKNIKNQLDIIDASIALITRNQKNKSYYKNMGYLSSTGQIDPLNQSKKEHKPHPTLFGATLAFGLNNAIGPHQSLNNSPYKIGNSSFFSFGFELRTMLSKNGFFRINYGIELQFNKLNPSNNLYFVDKDKQTVLEPYQFDLKKSHLNINNIVVPVYFEIGKVNESFHSSSFRFGLGGYGGLNMNAVQKLKYKRHGHKVKERLKNNYNTSNIIYGLGAYFGWRWFTLYVKYDLNTLFTHNPIEEHNASIGIRLKI